ncbi:MAG: DUF3857 domain-containing protein [Bacteroidetes bacterium]|nr:DUF3857 domain-containing protein [Bacteroidota bacterium]
MLFIINAGNAQERETAEFGNPTNDELTMLSYDKDPEATGVVLFESGKNYVKLVRNNIKLIKEVHRKIKVLDAKNFEYADIEIYYYKGKNGKEKINNLTAITHNGRLQTFVKSNAYYDIDESEKWSIKRFAFPNIKDGSILEYKYEIETPYFFNFGNWKFQGELPKIYSEFSSKIPGNYIYNRVIRGKNKLYINEASLVKGCFSLPGYAIAADCEVAIYAMKDISAFKNEKHMLSLNNYISRVDYELMTFLDFKGYKHKYTKTWKDVDREFRTDKDIGRQLNFKNYFKNKIPEEILLIADELEKAKAVYTFIQDHFIWDGKYRIFSEIRVKQAFEKKSGNISEINIALINAFKAADLNTKLALLSTRNNGLPTTYYPVLTDFNYVVAQLSINEKEYLIDATEKFNPFGILPFRALNINARIMDFKKGSYWTAIEPYKKNVNYLIANLTLDENELISGNVTEIYTGYKAIEKRKEIDKKTKSEYINSKQSVFDELEIYDYELEKNKNLEKPLKEKYSISFTPEIIGSKIYFYPYFLQNYYSENPFKLEKRQYPIELGYPSSNTYILSIDLKNSYEIVQLPSNKKIILTDGGLSCTVIYDNKDGKINLRFNLKLNTFRFDADEYQYLKEFFNKVVEIQTKEPIVLRKLI